MPDVVIATVTIKSDRPREVARFWRDLLGYEVGPNHSDSILLVGGEGPALLIQPAAERQSEGGIHLDLRPEDQGSCVGRAIALGARHADIGQTGSESWVVMADPGGNLFCILQSQADQKELIAHDPGSRSVID